MSHLNSNMAADCCGDAGLNYKLGQLGHGQLRFTWLSNKRNVNGGGGVGQEKCQSAEYTCAPQLQLNASELESYCTLHIRK